MGDVNLASVLIDGLMYSLMYCMAAFGLAIIFGMLRIMNFAQGIFFTLGAYFTYYFWATWGIPYPATIVVNILALLPIAWFLYWLLYGRGLESAFGGRVVGMVLISKSLAGIFTQGLVMLVGAGLKPMAPVIHGSVRFLGTGISNERIAVIAISVALIGGLIYMFNFTVFGNTIKAMVQQKTAARMVGINPWRLGLYAWLIGCVMTLIAGTLMAPIFGGASPASGGDIASKGVMMVIIGGVGSFQGIILAGFILGFVESFITYALDPNWASLIGYLMMFCIFVFKPSGLFGERIDIF